MAQFGRRSTAEQVSAGIDLRGKHALVTGANTGIGCEVTRVLALRGAHVTLACRDLGKAAVARARILDDAGGRIGSANLELLQLDLNSLAGTRRAAQEFCVRGQPLHLLINNAGVMLPRRVRTDDGFESQFGVNHLGHFLFTNLLLEPLLAAGGARVVAVSSAAMAWASLTPALHDLNWEQRKLSSMRAYGDSKLMNLMFAREFHRRYSDRGITANALHPGVIATELGRDQHGIFAMVGILAPPFMKSIGQGAGTTVYVATRPEYATRGGQYFSDCREKQRPDHKLALNDSACAELWRRSAELTGLN